MIYEKSKKELLFRIGVTVLIVLTIIFGFGVLLSFFIKIEEKQLKNGTYEYYQKQDTLIILKDLRNKSNIIKFVDNNYPDYKILKYKHIHSEYSNWDGNHNVYKFILIKKND